MSSIDPPAAALPWPRPAYAWYVVAMLVIALSFAIVDRTIISLLVDPIKKDLHISDSQIGLLQGLAFAICYTTFGLLLGFVTDRSNRRAVLTLGISFWSLSTIACGLASSFGTLFAARVGVGLGEAAIMPVAASMIADYFPAKKRGQAFGIFLLGGSIGIGIGNLMGGITIQLADGLRGIAPVLLGDLHNWQITFLAVGFPGLLVAAAFFITVREPVRREKIDARGGYSLGPLWRHMRANGGAYTTVMGGAVLVVTSISANSAWLATVFIRVHGWSPLQVGASLASMTLIGMTSAVTVGWALLAFAKRGRDDGPVWAIAAQSMAQMIFGPMVCLAPTPTLALVAYGIMLLVTNWASSASMTGLSQITPNELRGQVVAVYTLLTGVVSLTIGTLAVGFLSDHAFPDKTGIGPSLATVIFICGSSGTVLLLIGRNTFRAAAQRALVWQEKG